MRVHVNGFILSVGTGSPIQNIGGRAIWISYAYHAPASRLSANQAEKGINPPKRKAKDSTDHKDSLLGFCMGRLVLAMGVK